MGEIARMQTDFEKARRLYGTAADLYKRVDWVAGQAHCLMGLAKIAEAEGKRDEGRRLHVEAEGLFLKTAKPG